jgi:hypothetical protein
VPHRSRTPFKGSWHVRPASRRTIADTICARRSIGESYPSQMRALRKCSRLPSAFPASRGESYARGDLTKTGIRPFGCRNACCRRARCQASRNRKPRCTEGETHAVMRPRISSTHMAGVRARVPAGEANFDRHGTPLRSTSTLLQFIGRQIDGR